MNDFTTYLAIALVGGAAIQLGFKLVDLLWTLANTAVKALRARAHRSPGGNRTRLNCGIRRLRLDVGWYPGDPFALWSMNVCVKSDGLPWQWFTLVLCGHLEISVYQSDAVKRSHR